jgi:hypothetical protein
VQTACGDEAVNRSNVLGGILDFETGRELIEVGERGSRPKSTRTEVNIAAVTDLVKYYF